ncbi:uncharacterized protein ARMOST_12843 [Armillaria ostoyae]|uniref:Uncharacterized protein n=1 Tax=Armillaria ostoyae TaxID=47428 RepID=A0A284RL82_ARMOS|nr:uncharacterized protein ARMOST_12843 [Armillaria ostoyae]
MPLPGKGQKRLRFGGILNMPGPVERNPLISSSSGISLDRAGLICQRYDDGEMDSRSGAGSSRHALCTIDMSAVAAKQIVGNRRDILVPGRSYRLLSV